MRSSLGNTCPHGPRADTGPGRCTVSSISAHCSGTWENEMVKEMLPHQKVSSGLGVMGADLRLQAQQQVIVHGSWNRGHQELQCLAFLQPNKARACPGRSSPGACQALHHIKHLGGQVAVGGGSAKAHPFHHSLSEDPPAEALPKARHPPYTRHCPSPHLPMPCPPTPIPYLASGVLSLKR